MMPSLLLALVLSPSVEPPPVPRPQDPRAERVEAYLTAMHEAGRWNGTALVAAEGEVLLHAGFGWADLENDVPATTETRYRVASISKQFAAMAALLLAQRGALDLDRPITELLDDAPAAWSAVTTDHLVHHTSGISDYEGWFGGYTTQEYSDFMSAAGAPRRIYDRARGMRLDFEPGERFHYSNTGYVVLGYVLEAAAGESFEAFCDREIFEKLGMEHTLQDRHELLVPHRARGYARAPGTDETQLYRGFDREHLVNANDQRMEPPQPDAGLLTTAGDLFLWDQALYGETLLPEAARERYFAPGLGSYAFGWQIAEGSHGTTHQHSGGLPGFASHIVRIPESRSTIVLLGNFQHLDTKLLIDLLAILAGEPCALPERRPIVRRGREELEVFAGEYGASDGETMRFRALDGALSFAWGARNALAFPEPDDVFFVVFQDDREEALLRLTVEDDFVFGTLEDAFGELVVELGKL